MKAALVSQREVVVALAGNPNSGKTTVFNSLTGARQHVGNWPGVTVEKKEGLFSVGDKVIRVVDLPGTYSLDAYSADEAVARDYILFEQPDVVVNIVDATNLERNLYLTVQMMEMGANVVVALNMCDEAKAQEIDIDTDKLSKLLGVPVVPTVATRKQGLEEVVKAALQAAEKNREPLRIYYGKNLESKLSALEQKILSIPWLAEKYTSRWLAVKLLEGGEEDLFVSHPEIIQLLSTDPELANDSENGDEDAESIIIDCRYSFISGIANEAVIKGQITKLSVSDRIDRIVTNRYLGIPIFFMAMWLLFQFTFALGEPLVAGIEFFFDRAGDFISAGLDSLCISALIKSLIVDGVIKGLGSVLVFIPNIFLLFFAISLLEDSGYMARAAYIMDRFMHTLGLHGKSFIPLLIGFGCNVPAIMATRTLENKKDRMITILISPLISCSARLPVYLLFAGAFFSAYQGLVVFSLYFLGIVLAVVMGMVFKRFFFKGETSHFVMELPPYRVPTLKSTFIHMWERGSSFIRKAGTLIFAVVLLVWLLANLPAGVEYASQASILGRIGRLLAPVFKPAGFGTWEAAVALLFGIVAKEVVVGTLGLIYGVQGAGLTAAIASNWTPLSAYAFMVMTLVYVPCVATIGAIKRETNSWGWTAFALGYSLVLGWLLAVLVFQVGSLLGLS
mgnify:CR=1 FL=1